MLRQLIYSMAGICGPAAGLFTSPTMRPFALKPRVLIGLNPDPYHCWEYCRFIKQLYLEFSVISCLFSLQSLLLKQTAETLRLWAVAQPVAFAW